MNSPRSASLELLADHVEIVPTIAHWHFDEWVPSDSAVTVQELTARIATWTNRDAIPLTYVAMDRGLPLGSASLVVHDMSPPAPGCEELTPWLSGVFVIPERRGTGLGAALVGACEGAAANLDYPEIYLHTAPRTAEGFYAPMGWRVLDMVEYDGEQVTVMAKALAV